MFMGTALPVKMRIIQMLLQSKEMWDYEIAKEIFSEYPERFVHFKRLNAYLAEMKASGLIEDRDRAVESTGSTFSSSELFHKIRLTALGVERANFYNLRHQVS